MAGGGRARARPRHRLRARPRPGHLMRWRRYTGRQLRHRGPPRRRRGRRLRRHPGRSHRRRHRRGGDRRGDRRAARGLPGRRGRARLRHRPAASTPSRRRRRPSENASTTAPTRCGSSSPSWSATSRTRGTVAFRRAGPQYSAPRLVLFTGGVTPPAATPPPRRGPSTARPTAGLPRPRVLPRAAAALRRPGRLRPGLRDRPRVRPPRAEPAGDHASRCRSPSATTRRTPTSCRCGSSCRPTAWPGSGPTRPTSENLLEEGDLEEGLNAAAAVGDDRIQERATGRIDPESFTHGTSEQRRDWFLRGFEEGTIAACDTFA